MCLSAVASAVIIDLEPTYEELKPVLDAEVSKVDPDLEPTYEELKPACHGVSCSPGCI